MFYRHKLTGQALLHKKSYNGVSSCYVLDEFGEKIPDKNKNGVHLRNADGSLSYKIYICQNENLIKQPLNDNVLQMNKDQMKWCFEVVELAEQLNGL